MYHILYVDSQEEELALFKTQFSEKHIVYTATNKKDALSIIKKNVINLVINGLSIQEKATKSFLKNINSTEPHPILILLTACHDFLQLKDSINENRVFKVVNKPYHLDDFRMIIRNGLNNYQLLLDNEHKVALQQQNQIQSNILNALEDGLYLASNDYAIIFANAKMKEIIGHDATGQKCYKAIYGLDGICSDCPLKDISASNRKIESEIIYHERVYSKSYTLLNEESRLTVYHEITEQKKNEEKIKQLLGEQTSILAASPIGIIFLQDQKAIWVNQKIIEMFNYSIDEVIGFTTEKYYKSAADYKEILKRVYIALSKGDIYREKWEMIRKDGTLFWAEIIGKAINQNDLSQGSIWMINNIDAFVSSEKKLKESEGKFHSIFANSNDAIMLSELHEDAPGRFVEINDSACEKLGYTRDELLQMTPKDITPLELKGKIKPKINQIKVEGFLLHESIHITKSKQHIPVEISTSIIELKGHKVLLSIVRDIGERTKALGKLKSKTDELELFNEAMINREMRIVSMKEEVNKLLLELGREIVYPELWKEGTDEQ